MENKTSFVVKLKVIMGDGPHDEGSITTFVAASSYDEAVQKGPQVAQEMTRLDQGRTDWTYKFEEVVRPVRHKDMIVHEL